MTTNGRSSIYDRAVFFFIEILELNANSEDPDQTPRSAASHLCLHCMPMPFLWDTRHKWGNMRNNQHILSFQYHTLKVPGLTYM